MVASGLFLFLISFIELVYGFAHILRSRAWIPSQRRRPIVRYIVWSKFDSTRCFSKRQSTSTSVDLARNSYVNRDKDHQQGAKLSHRPLYITNLCMSERPSGALSFKSSSWTQANCLWSSKEMNVAPADCCIVAQMEGAENDLAVTDTKEVSQHYKNNCIANHNNINNNHNNNNNKQKTGVADQIITGGDKRKEAASTVAFIRTTTTTCMTTQYWPYRVTENCRDNVRRLLVLTSGRHHHRYLSIMFCRRREWASALYLSTRCFYYHSNDCCRCNTSLCIDIVRSLPLRLLPFRLIQTHKYARLELMV